MKNYQVLQKLLRELLYNKNQKNGINIGRKNNKKFLDFPHSILKDILTYRCKEEGINFILQEESYTSKVSCINANIWEFNLENKVNNPKNARGIRVNMPRLLPHRQLRNERQ